MRGREKPDARGGHAWPLALGACLVLGGCGGGTTRVIEAAAAPSVASTPSPTPAITAECLAAAPPPIDKKKPPPPDPDEGLSDAERAAKDEAHFQRSMRNLAEWEASAAVQALDPRTLPQIGSLGDAMPGYATLQDSVRHADLAVLGTVERTKAVDHGLLTEILVERTAKGRHRARVTIGQDASVNPLYGFDSTCAQLAVNEAYPPLLVGDRAVLLLKKFTAGYLIQPWSGEYRSVGGRVEATALNQFHDVDGYSEAELMDRIARS